MHRKKTNLYAVGLFAAAGLLPFLPGRAAAPINVDTRNLLVPVDADNAAGRRKSKGRRCR